MKKILLTLMLVSYLNVDAQNPVQEFNFNGNLNSADNTISFLGAANYVNDRMGVAKSAQRLVNKALQAVVGDLPQDNKPRSISLWVKFNTINAANYIFGYGSPSNGQYFGLLQQASSSGNSDLSLAGWGSANDVIVSVPLAKEVWYHYAVTYNGNASKVYRNGELLKSVDGISRSTKGYIFRLGEINTTTGVNADIDDLKIYNVAMTDEQVMESYNSSKPLIIATPAVSSSETVKKGGATNTKNTASAKTLPANKTAANDKNTVSKNIEVFSQGKKVLGSTTGASINDLPEGTYLLKITDTSPKK
nr:LamG domain-containing protein [uncultured Flavobacterium sp.]